MPNFCKSFFSSAPVLGWILKSLFVAALILPPRGYADDIAWVWHSSPAPSNFKEIALLLDHLVISGDHIQIRRRQRELVVDALTRVTPVVHVQTDAKHPTMLGPRHTEAIVNAMRDASRRSTSGWVQLDFEARTSEQAYFIALVRVVRQSLPPALRLSVTTMAQSCQQPGFLEQVQADEIVPLFFYMGTSADSYRARLQRDPQALDNRCRQTAAGFAVQETPEASVQNRYARRYWFNYKNWNLY